MKNFYNERRTIVTDAIDGLIASAGGRLRRFDPSSHARVVVRADWDKNKVAIISGGGSGHEPAHAGLIGPGLLTAAVCGEVNASPSVDAVLSAILNVCGTSGCLLIIKNYTGDRLNFGLAAEKAKAMGYKVEMVIVGDDIAIADAVQPRGLAGTIFVHKVAGYLSEQGESLEAVFEAAQAVAGDIKTLGLSRDTSTVPGSDKQDRIADNEVEVGLGIHGEPGVDVKSFSDCTALMQNFSSRLLACVDESKRHLALFNNLGGLNGLECSILFKEFMASDLAKVVDFTMGPVPIMTALDMPGFSISLVPLESSYRQALLSNIDCNAWPQISPVVKSEPIVPPALPGVPSFASSNEPEVRKVIEAIIASCLSSEADLNELDAKVGDGDTGTTFAAAARTIQGELDNLPMANGAELFTTLSDLTSKLMGGSSGVLFAILFANAAEAFRNNSDWASSLSAGLDAMQKYGGAGPGDRTMIDSLKPALDALVSGSSIQDAAVQARAGADATAKMLSAKAGRSAYLEARSLDGYADPGAEGVARIFEKIAQL
ncbi:dihydroxyacetone kinase subunit DhaK [Granulosicoccus antarcticus]|uniref:Dihydroxyacetone kinase n=1 Tax=Granulosicoccus antarcticus IMCC3135 TaxID=1192854 RepID=A0A2Z2NQT8_9GAMM|nr:dihydroxyacetone kinase subunit DhaK [Granulosicoccus antarcticus]ASJ73846.1 Dihydroxyacetone kinase [Granulosicoccus antarcticus IMCC3135]